MMPMIHSSLLPTSKRHRITERLWLLATNSMMIRIIRKYVHAVKMRSKNNPSLYSVMIKYSSSWESATPSSINSIDILPSSLHLFLSFQEAHTTSLSPLNAKLTAYISLASLSSTSKFHPEIPSKSQISSIS